VTNEIPAISVALVGYGYVGKIFHAPLIAATAGLRLDWVVSSDETKVQADFPGIKVATSLDQALADPLLDLVVIATPNGLHAPQAIAALQAGKHVVVDKPFTLSVAEAKDVISQAEAAGRLLSVFHNRRWDGDFLTLKRLIAEGGLGQIREFRSHYDRFRPEVRPRWRESAVPGAGTWFDLAPHLIDQALQLFGWPQAIAAEIVQQRVGALAPDYFHVQLFYPQMIAILHSSCLVADARLRFAAHGDGGSFVKYGLDRQEDALKLGVRPGHGDWGRDDGAAAWTALRDGQLRRQPLSLLKGDYRGYYAAMRDAIRFDAPLPVTPDQALAVMTLLEHGRISAECSAKITLQPIR
jgi:predicted dehydrogenase